MIEYVEQLLESILFGFALYTFGRTPINSFLSIQVKKKLNVFDYSVCTLIPAVSVFYLLVSLQLDYTRYTTMMANPMVTSAKTTVQHVFW